VVAFYIDENVSFLLDGFLRGYGHSVISTHDEGREGSPDPHQLFYATEHNWVLITHNANDFIGLTQLAGIFLVGQVFNLSASQVENLRHRAFPPRTA